MNVRPVDPRDTTIEIDEPAYRVYFWRMSDFACAEYEVTDVREVRDVLAWADANKPAGYDDYGVHVTVALGGEVCLVRLAGVNPA